MDLISTIARQCEDVHAIRRGNSGEVVYGGDLRDGGSTDVLVDQASRYGTSRRSLTLCLPWSGHAATPVDDLDAYDRALGTSGELVSTRTARGSSLVTGRILLRPSTSPSH